MFKKIIKYFENKKTVDKIKDIDEILESYGMPDDLINIIYYHINGLENRQKIKSEIIKYADKNLSNIKYYISDLTENGRSEIVNNYINEIVEKNKHLGFTEEEVFDIILHNVYLYYSGYLKFLPFFGSGVYNYAKIEDIPRNIVRRFKSVINWKWVGSGFTISYRYTKIEDLPRDFVEEFKNEICWDFVGSGYRSFSKIENLPRDFVEQFKDKINWKYVGSGKINGSVSFTKKEDLPQDFLEKFKKYIN